MKKITYEGQSKILIALCNLVNELVDTVGSAGDGDMKKSVYDTDGNGIVDNAEKVNNHTVNANVPENAVFTDTTYTFSQSGSQLTLTDDDGNAQSVNVPSTDTNTTYTMSLDGSKLTLTDSDGKTQDVTLPSGGSGSGSTTDSTTEEMDSNGNFITYNDFVTTLVFHKVPSDFTAAKDIDYSYVIPEKARPKRDIYCDLKIAQGNSFTILVIRTDGTMFFIPGENISAGNWMRSMITFAH